MPLVECLLREQGMGFTVPEIAWGRSDQFRDFVRVLELSTIDLDAGAGIAEQRFRESFNDAGLPRSGGP